VSSFKPGVLNPNRPEPFQPVNMPNLGKEFVEVGKEIEDLWMRTVFDSTEEMNAAVAYHGKLMRYHLTERLKEFRYWLAAKPSVKGRSRDQLLQAITGVVVPQWGNSKKISNKVEDSN
jgi:hypothetical protein